MSQNLGKIWFIFKGLAYWAFIKERQRTEGGSEVPEGRKAELGKGMGWKDGNADYPHNEADKTRFQLV